MDDLTKFERAVYEYVCRHKQSHGGNSPTYREIADGAGISSTSVVRYALDGLAAHGLIKLPYNSSRDIYVVGGEWLRPLRRTAPCKTTHRFALVNDLASPDNEIVDGWLAGKAEITRRTYQSVVRRMIEFIGKDLSSITANDLFDYKWSLIDYASNSVSLYVRIIKSLFRYGVDAGYFYDDPAEGLDLPKLDAPLLKQELAPDDVEQIIAQVNNASDKLMIWFFYATNATVAELCGLRWFDLFLTNPDQFEAVHLKGKEEFVRIVLLDPALYNALIDLWTERNAVHSDSVFLNQRGAKPLDCNVAWRIMERAAERAGFLGISPRHRCAGSPELPLVLTRMILSNPMAGNGSVYWGKEVKNYA